MKITAHKPSFLRAKRIALVLSVVTASDILFLIYGYSEKTYQQVSFWEVRVPVFVAIFVVAFLALWLRSGPKSQEGGPQSERRG